MLTPLHACLLYRQLNHRQWPLLFNLRYNLSTNYHRFQSQCHLHPSKTLTPSPYTLTSSTLYHSFHTATNNPATPTYNISQFSSYTILDSPGNTLVLLANQDDSTLPCFKQVMVSVKIRKGVDGISSNSDTNPSNYRFIKGIVLKTGDTQQIGLYEPWVGSVGEKVYVKTIGNKTNKSSSNQTVHVSKINLQTKRKSNQLVIPESLAKLLSQPTLSQNYLLSIDLEPIQHFQFPPTSSIQQPKDSRLWSTYPALNICYDLKMGQIIGLIGQQANQKTQIAMELMWNFGERGQMVNDGQTKNDRHQKRSEAYPSNSPPIIIYFHPTSKSKAIQALKQTKNCLALCSQSSSSTHTSIYMLGLKAIQLAKILKEDYNRNVMLVIDGFKDYLEHEWAMLQVVKYGQKVGEKTMPYKGAQQSKVTLTDNKRAISALLSSTATSMTYRSDNLKVAPMSLLNQIAAATGISIPNSNSESYGSLTTVIVSHQNNDELQLKAEISPFSNTHKHLISLCDITITPPMKLSANMNQWHGPTHLQSNYQRLRHTVATLIQEQKSTDLLRKLFPQQSSQQPWNHWATLDAKWWRQSLQLSRPDHHQFVEFICMNIEYELCARWKGNIEEVWKMYREKKDGQWDTFEEFVQWAKFEDLMHPFQKDYL